MNAVEIEEAISLLAEQPFVAAEFPYAFLEAFGNKETTIKRLRAGNSNKSDVDGGVLQQNNIHIAVCYEGEVTETLLKLKVSPATIRTKVKFVLATDGKEFQAEDLNSGETVACDYQSFHDHFGFFLPLAGISTVKQIRENAFDIKATSRLNKLYIELLNHNQEWAKAERRQDMNHFLARLIFCFFAEDTDIFERDGLFTETVRTMSSPDASDTHEVIKEIFRAMDSKREDRAEKQIKNWTARFPYVNGQLFSGSVDVPRFTKIARSYLLHVGNLDWKKINPDIFGSMIQAVADDEERSALGMHYTSVPNILKVLNPLFLDNLRAQLDEAGDNHRRLLSLRKRLAHIRVFDPACGSGNFLVIAYKQMREIEAEINKRRGDKDRESEIPLTNFRGIELRGFSAEIARLALIIAEYQCDVLHRGQKLALAEFLPLSAENWIICGNALRIEWLSVCPPSGTGVKLYANDLFSTPLKQSEIAFENEGGETYICGNPPYKGSQTQTGDQKSDLKAIFDHRTKNWKTLDYVSGWFMKAADYGTITNAASAFVSTNSVCQGRQVEVLWSLIFETKHKIQFAHTSFKWANLASYNAGVTVAIIGISNQLGKIRRLFSILDDGSMLIKEVDNINAYLISASSINVVPRSSPLSAIGNMDIGSMANDDGGLLFDNSEAARAIKQHGVERQYIRKAWGSREFISGLSRSCLWLSEGEANIATKNPWVANRINFTKNARSNSLRQATKKLAEFSHRFGEVRQRGNEQIIIIPKVSSEIREYLPVGLLPPGSVITDLAFGILNSPLWNMALIASKLHRIWIITVCGQLETRIRYSNTLGWNTFPVPTLTEKNKADLTSCVEEILLARERHFPASIAELYEPNSMPEDLRRAHDRNDEVVERIYVGRRFKNDTERLEKLFALYIQMTPMAKPHERN